MSQASTTIEDGSGDAVLQAINAAFASVQSQSSGPAAPLNPEPHQFWADEATGWLKQRNASNDAWLKRARLADWSLPSVQTQNATRFTTAGTADAMTGVLAPVITDYADGLRVTCTPPSANTLTAPTLGLHVLGGKKIFKRDRSGIVALVAGDYNNSGPFDFEFRTSLDSGSGGWVLLNPLPSSAVGVPVGTTIYVPATTPPAGFLKKNGALLSRTAYAALWAFAQASGNMAASDGVWQVGQFSPGDGSTTFRIPDGRAEFTRGWDDGRGVDGGRGIGTFQAASQIGQGVSGVNGGAMNLLVFADTEANATNSDGGSNTSSQGSANRTYTVGRVRPRNVAELACIKY